MAGRGNRRGVPVRFSVNVQMLFAEAPLLERFALVAGAGFGAVESWWPAGEDLDRFGEAVRESGLELVLLNFDGGDASAGDRGLLGDLERSARFRENVPIALELAASIGCRRLNALLGLARPGQTRDEQLQLAVENARWAADLAARQDAEVLIEPINRFDNGPYLLQRVEQVAAFIADVGRPNVRLQFDAYHMQRTEGDLIAQLERHAGLIAHVQIADNPGRGFPGSGEIDFAALFRALHRVGYDGHVGLEYRADGSTSDALAWLAPELRGDDHTGEAIAEYWTTG